VQIEQPEKIFENFAKTSANNGFGGRRLPMVNMVYLVVAINMLFLPKSIFLLALGPGQA
jgi:hypothetical protein